MYSLAKTLVVMLVLLWAPAVYGQGAVPAGGEFQVNSFTTGTQYHPSVATLADGGFVVLWQSYGSSGSDSDSASIQGQRYAADGTTLGEQFQVNSYTTAWQSLPSVAARTDGGFVALWRSYGSSGSDSDGGSIQGQRYAADGTTLGEQFQVNSYTTGSQSLPSVAAWTAGGFVALWQSDGSSGSDFSGKSIQGQRYAADGTTLGEQFQVNSYTSNSQFDPSGATLAGGGFVALWTSYGSSDSDTHNFSIQGQRYAADGTTLGEQFQVNSHTSSGHLGSAVAALAGGGFVALWHGGSSGSDSDAYSIQGRRYAADGTTLGEQFQVNSYTTGWQVSPSVAASADGGFVATWRTGDISGPTHGQRYAADGMALGGEFQVSSETTGRPSAATLPEGGFVVTWESSGGSDILGRRFAAPRFALVGLAGKCLDVEGADPADGTPVNLSRCHGGDNQRWRLDLTSVPQRIVGIGGKCLIPDFDHPSGDVRVVIGECGGPGDLWQLLTTGHAAPSVLIHDQTGLCLDVEGAVPDDGTPTQLFECHGGANQVWRPAAEVCTRDSLGLCLKQERFRVDLEWRSFDGTVGSGKAVPVGTDDSGLLWFFEADNWEMLIKVLDGCAFNDRFWVFAAATTTVEYTLRVTDSHVGTVREYFNPLGNAAAAITDTQAFDACPAAGAASSAETVDLEPISFSDKAGVPPKGSCVPSPTQMCLADGRFSLEVTWRDYADSVGSGQVVPVGSPDSGMFWFFDSDNWEMLVKVLDACDINGQFLFLGAANTDVEYTVTVTDMDTGVFWQHTNPLGHASDALVHWFETCS